MIKCQCIYYEEVAAKANKRPLNPPAEAGGNWAKHEEICIFCFLVATEVAEIVSSIIAKWEN
jgi:hypothetical protein